MDEAKKLLRTEKLSLINQTDLNQLKAADQKITGQVTAFLSSLKPLAICLYVNINREVETKQIISFALENEIKVYVPKVIDKTTMQFYQIFKLADLVFDQQHKFIEPVTQATNLLTKTDEVNVVFFPLTVFDDELNRIGSGFGYYDRWISNSDYQGLKVGLARVNNYSQQPIVINEFDVSLDFVITEQGIYLPKTKSKINSEQLKDWSLHQKV